MIFNSYGSTGILPVFISKTTQEIAMISVLSAREISLEELTEKFDLQFINQPDFFTEYKDNLPVLNEVEKQALERVKNNYFNLTYRRPLSEEAVKMVVLSPLLDLAGFYQAPFLIETETSIEITAKDEDVIVRGNIDVLVIQKRFWVLVIESKSTKFDVMTALPQALAYMLNAPKNQKSVFGLLVNGREFVFVKLTQDEIPKYSRSLALSIERDEEFYQVLSILKQLRDLIIC